MWVDLLFCLVGCCVVLLLRVFGLVYFVLVVWCFVVCICLLFCFKLLVWFGRLGWVVGLYLILLVGFELFLFALLLVLVIVWLFV